MSVLDALLELLYRQTRIDFQPYLRRMVMQRVWRRMKRLNDDAIEAYLKRCQVDILEVEALGKELLNGATRFFRNPSAFEQLRCTVIPTLMRKATTAGQLRVWVAGCGTGEEAYSIAMLLHEGLMRYRGRHQDFATDIEAEALAVAGRGL